MSGAIIFDSKSSQLFTAFFHYEIRVLFVRMRTVCEI